MEMIPIARDDIPGFANQDNPTSKLLVAFLKGDADCVEVVKMPHGLESTASALRNAVSNNRLPVKVMQRQKRLFLVKKEEA